MLSAPCGIKMAVRVPVAAYLSIVIRMEPPAEDTPGTISILLEHRDSALSLPLFSATDGTDIVAEWQSRARVLGMPLLVANADGRLREPTKRIGAVVATVSWQRVASARRSHRDGRHYRCGELPGVTPVSAVVPAIDEVVLTAFVPEFESVRRAAPA